MKIIKWGEWKNNSHSKCFYTKEEYKCVAEAAKSAGYRFPGDYHQEGKYGVPYFDNGIQFMVSKKEWGTIMAMAWPEVIEEWRNQNPIRKHENLDYVAFAWYSEELKNKYVYPQGSK